MYYHPAYLTYMQSTSCKMIGWMKHKMEARLRGEISITSDMQMAESEEELKSLLMKVKEESEKAGLKLNFQKTKIKVFGPITSWQIDGETMVTVRDFILGIPKSLQVVTAAMKLRHLLIGKKSMTKLNSILKSRDITLPTKVHLVKAMVFPVVIYGCESWTLKKAEH